MHARRQLARLNVSINIVQEATGPAWHGHVVVQILPREHALRVNLHLPTDIARSVALAALTLFG